MNFSSNLGEWYSEDKDILSTFQKRFAFLAPKLLNLFHFSPVLFLGSVMFSGSIAMHNWAQKS